MEIVSVLKIHGSVDSSVPIILPAQVWIQSTPSMPISIIAKFVLYLSWHCEKNTIKQKSRVWPTFKNTLFYCCQPSCQKCSYKWAKLYRIIGGRVSLLASTYLRLSVANFPKRSLRDILLILTSFTWRRKNDVKCDVLTDGHFV